MDYLPAVAGPILKRQSPKPRQTDRPSSHRQLEKQCAYEPKEVRTDCFAEATHEKELKLLPNDEGAKEVD